MRKYAQVSNETYLYDKRSLSSMRKCQKRPIHMTKEAFLYDERSLLRLAYLRYAEVPKETYNMAKETYHMAKETYHMAKEVY